MSFRSLFPGWRKVAKADLSNLSTHLLGWLYDRNEVYFNPYTNLTTTTPFGFSGTPAGATVANQTVTLTGASAFIQLAGDKIPSGLRCLMAEAVISKGTATKPLKIDLRNLAGTVLLTYSIDPATNEITVSVGDTDTIAPGSNFDLSNGVGARFALGIYPMEGTSFLSLRWKDTGAAGLASQKYMFSDDHTWAAGVAQITNEVRLIRFMTDATETGTWLIRELAVSQPTFVSLGSSLEAGTDGENGGALGAYTPFPGYAPENRDWDMTYLLGRALGKWGLNFGVASGGIQGVQALRANILRFRPKVVVGDFGLTNNLNNLDLDANIDANRALLMTALETEVDALIAGGAMPVVRSLIPRNWSAVGYTDAEIAASAVLVNTAIQRWKATKKIGYVDLWDDFAGVGTMPSALLVPDGSHPNSMGKRLTVARTQQTLAALFSAMKL